ncbi:MAG TPA: hypothetical protein VIG51_01870 [Candidatus Baltobacteraceae bacterium]|jgi:hypothetical protein
MHVRWLAAILTATLAFTGCAQSKTTTVTTTASTAMPAAAQSNPPGDIPDTQLFVPFKSTGAYAVLAPEGWSRSVSGSNVTFVWNYDGERVVETSGALNGAAVLGAIRTAFGGVKDAKTKVVTLPGGPATLVTYTSESAPDAVTGKRVRLENNSYVFRKNGKSARLDLWAPQGSDNVDQWNKISRSFAWK